MVSSVVNPSCPKTPDSTTSPSAFGFGTSTEPSLLRYFSGVITSSDVVGGSAKASPID
ncbi:MAG: hypothetical protein IPF42_09470 [Candidatus Microthrix sp.]|nr:hypothetical protein [Candidatus Microthrix sp.]